MRALTCQFVLVQVFMKHKVVLYLRLHLFRELFYHIKLLFTIWPIGLTVSRLCVMSFKFKPLIQLQNVFLIPAIVFLDILQQMSKLIILSQVRHYFGLDINTQSFQKIYHTIIRLPPRNHIRHYANYINTSSVIACCHELPSCDSFLYQPKHL